MFDDYWSRAPAALVQFGFPEWDDPDNQMKDEFRALADEVLEDIA